MVDAWSAEVAVVGAVGAVNGTLGCDIVLEVGMFRRGGRARPFVDASGVLVGVVGAGVGVSSAGVFCCVVVGACVTFLAGGTERLFRAGRDITVGCFLILINGRFNRFNRGLMIVYRPNMVIDTAIINEI